MDKCMRYMIDAELYRTTGKIEKKRTRGAEGKRG